MRMTGVALSSRRKSRTMASTRATLTPAFRPRLPAAWMIGPSAIGSVKGIPISIRSAPAPGIPRRISIEVAWSGSHASRYGISAPRPACFSSAKRAAMRLMPRVPGITTPSERHPKSLGDGENILVAAPTKIHQDDLFLVHRRRQLLHICQRVRRFQSRNDPLGPGAERERVQSLLIRGRNVFDAADIVQPGMLRPDPRIV